MQNALVRASGLAMVIKRRTAIALTAVALTACSSAPVRQPPEAIAADPSKLASIRSIVVLRFPEKFAYQVLDMNTPVSTTILGGLMDLGEKARRDNLAARFTKESRGFSAKLSSAIADQLRTAGYDVSLQDGPWDTAADGRYVLATDRLPAAGDAVLTIQLNFVGYAMEVTAGTSLLGSSVGEYRPWVTCVVELLRGDKREVVYRSFYSSGVQLKEKRWTFIPPQKTFAGLPALEKDFEGAIAALDDVALVLAARIRDDLRRP